MGRDYMYDLEYYIERCNIQDARFIVTGNHRQFGNGILGWFRHEQNARKFTKAVIITGGNAEMKPASEFDINYLKEETTNIRYDFT